MATPRANQPRKKRVCTPYPKSEIENENEEPLFAKATQIATHRFESNLASFTIRRPFGMAGERLLWFDVGVLNAKQYEAKAKISNPASLEVVAEINADGSTLVLHGGACARLRSDADSDWDELGNVDETNKPLGPVAYIDKDANEMEYSLGEFLLF